GHHDAGVEGRRGDGGGDGALQVRQAGVVGGEEAGDLAGGLVVVVPPRRAVGARVGHRDAGTVAVRPAGVLGEAGRALGGVGGHPVVDVGRRGVVQPAPGRGVGAGVADGAGGEGGGAAVVVGLEVDQALVVGGQPRRE